MSEQNFVEFAKDEIQSLILIEEFEEEVTTRGISSKELLKWVNSLNAYENPKTGQKFSVRITTDTREEQALLREHLRVGARVVHAIDDEITEVLELENNDHQEPAAEQSVDGPTIKIHFELLDAAEVVPPYEIQFYFDPSSVPQALSEAEDFLEDHDNEESPVDGRTRSGQAIMIQRRTASYDTTFTGKRIRLNVKAKSILAGSLIQTRLFGVQDSSPPRGLNDRVGFFPVLKTGNTNLNVSGSDSEAYTFEVQVIGTGTYEYRGKLWP